MNERELNSAILAAIGEEDLDRLMALIGSDQNLLHKVGPWGTWLAAAACSGKANVVKLFLKLGVDPNVPGGPGSATAVWDAAIGGHIDVMRQLIAAGALMDVSAPERNPLFGAISSRHADAAKLLIDAGIGTRVKYKRSSGQERDAMSFAREYGLADVVSAIAAVQGTPLRKAAHAPAQNAIVAEMSRRFGPVRELGLQEILPVTGIRINVIPSRSKDQPLILFTTGMSDVAQTVPKGREAFKYTELLIRLPANWNLSNLKDAKNSWPIEWLKRVAIYPREHKTWLGGALTIVTNGEPPRPIAPNTKMSCMMIMRETLEAEAIICPDGRRVLLFGLFPLYKEERDLELSKGAPALFERFDSLKIPFVADPKRVNVGVA